jgi:hypothetical protein
LNGDKLSGSLATAATTTSNVGAYGITQGSLTNANCAISYLGANLTILGANLAVTAAPLTDAQSAVFPSYFSSNDFTGNGGDGLACTQPMPEKLLSGDVTAIAPILFRNGAPGRQSPSPITI